MAAEILQTFFWGVGGTNLPPAAPYKRLQTLRHYISSLAWDIKLSNWEMFQIWRRSLQWCRRSNPKFEISIVRCLARGASFSHNESECLCFNSRCTNLSRQSTERGRISTPSCHFWRQGRQHSRFLRPLLPAVLLFCREYGRKQRSANKGDEGRERSDLIDFIQTIKGIQLKYLLL